MAVKIIIIVGISIAAVAALYIFGKQTDKGDGAGSR